MVNGDAEGVAAKRAPAVKIVSRAKMDIPRFINITFDEDDEFSTIQSELVARQLRCIKKIFVE